MRKVIYQMRDGKCDYSCDVKDINIYFGGLLSVAKYEIPKTVLFESDFGNVISVDIIAEIIHLRDSESRNIVVKLHNPRVNLSRSIVFNTDVIRERYSEDHKKAFLEDWHNYFVAFEHDCKVQIYNTAAGARFNVKPYDPEKYRREFLGIASPSKEMMKVGAYVANDILSCMEAESRRRNFMKFDIDKVIYHDPATIVYWADGTKTVVKTQNGETYDPEKGLAMCFAKKARGNKGNYYEEFKKHLPKEEYANPWCTLLEIADIWHTSVKAVKLFIQHNFIAKENVLKLGDAYLVRRGTEKPSL